MFRNISESTLKKSLRSYAPEPSALWQKETLARLRTLAQTEEVEYKSEVIAWSWRTRFIFWGGLLRRAFVPVLTVLIAVGVILPNWQTADLPEYARHVEKARTALKQIEHYVASGEIALTEPTPSFFPQAEAAVSSEESVVELVETVRSETKIALEKAQILESEGETVAALSAIAELQQDTLEIVSDALVRLQDDSAVERVTFALEDTSEENLNLEAHRKTLLAMNTNSRTLAFENQIAAPFSLEKAADQDQQEDTLASAKMVKETPPQAEAPGETQDQKLPENSLEKTLPSNNRQMKFAEAEAILAPFALAEKSRVSPRLEPKFQKLEAILKSCSADSEHCEGHKAKGLAIGVRVRLERERHEQSDQDRETPEQKSENSGQSSNEENNETHEDGRGSQEENSKSEDQDSGLLPVPEQDSNSKEFLWWGK